MPGTGNSGGRNKRSRQAHVIAGTFRNTRHKDQADVTVPEGRPELPKQLEGEALAEWHRMITRLEQTKVISTVDDAAIYQYARLFGETEQAAQDKAETAAAVQILEENIGDMKGPDLVAAFQEISKMRRLVHAYSTTVRQGRMAIRQFLVEFGMTPAARTRVKPKGADDLDDDERELASILSH